MVHEGTRLRLRHNQSQMLGNIDRWQGDKDLPKTWTSVPKKDHLVGSTPVPAELPSCRKGLDMDDSGKDEDMAAANHPREMEDQIATTENSTLD